MNIITLSAAQMADKLAAGEITSRELVQAHLDRIEAVEPKVHAFLHINAEEALRVADEVDAARAAGETLHRLAGVPIAIKDLIVTKGQPTTAGSKMLEGWVSPYDATVIERIRDAKLPILGKTNLDEFAMGSSTEHSAFGPTRNPWGLDRIPGGSGGGSAAAVAAFEAPLALGTDTGGSIRQPGAVTGTVGAKPTYGAVSRYGAIAMASSLDQIGPVARTVEDAALLQELIGGHDPKDSTSLAEPLTGLAEAAASGDIAGLKVGIVTELMGEGYEDGVMERFRESIEALREAGAEIVEVSCPNFKHALGAYYLVMPSEVSSNLAKFDGVRFGNRELPAEPPLTIERVMATTRAKGFGAEVKRRIILGTYALSAGYKDAYYGSAQKIRTLIQRDFDAAFEKADVLMSPTAPTVAFELGSKTSDPLEMYLNDIATIPANLAGVPGISVPGGLSEGLPVGIQFLAPAKEDARMYQVAAGLERLLEEQWGGPISNQIQDLESAETPAGQAAAQGEK
ncbi:Asp-tRNA(Asn)/Glu-tRNA(Gln) amidotransferase subunit GatA [Falsarthrobacter nasiphocae]|uniref:Glutamyl-tRNA(Gln) amidotransferase subunit A n=1 Tax=Falsarthrobacter nasiphocae TaxID=189863 RepID=A0AAE3YIF2_9MICC|nr:Asp-tRNA(Asn)/Glu-tRNA(Gln) amidotransferase subunit GatA [Falsarthrobacter nasiphocae]MDR6892601.1 aspartyl-tRNA(Asn)/glutamyl-tRNA(Gln) amidotransferase subunit A [Falsarthrobacter nasiphocae]